MGSMAKRKPKPKGTETPFCSCQGGCNCGRFSYKAVELTVGCPASSILADLASISFTDSPPVPDPVAEQRRYGSWGR